MKRRIIKVGKYDAAFGCELEGAIIEVSDDWKTWVEDGYEYGHANFGEPRDIPEGAASLESGYSVCFYKIKTEEIKED